MAGQIDTQRRSQLLAEYFHLKKFRADMRKRLAKTSGPDAAEMESSSRSAFERMRQLTDEYRGLLEVVPLSRCPFCGHETALPFDRHGLDGLFWDYDAGVRPPVPRPCPHFLVLSGAMKLTLPPANVPMLAVPGPEVPWVVPRLLGLSRMRAVVSTVAVGPHTGYPIAYYADPDPQIELVNEWGRDHYTTWRADGSLGWNEVVKDDRDYDYELAPWLARERLHWIAPGDPEMKLRSGTAGMPYLGLEGRRGVVKVQDGLTWVFGWEIEGQV